MFRLTFVLTLIVAMNHYLCAQNEFSREQIQENYEFPAWYTEAGFGIWVHWGAQTQPEKGGGWYARHMYMQDVGNQQWGVNAYPYHVKTYGHPSEKGFKDVIHEWKAENLDTDGLLKYFIKSELLPDGTIPPDHKEILDDIGEWVTLHGEAIYASKPWKIYGDNLGSSLRLMEETMATQNQVSEADLEALEALKKEGDATHFSERTVNSPPYGPDEVRFTTKGSHLYIFVMNPSTGTIQIPSLGSGSPQKPKKIMNISMLGGDKKVKFEQKADALELIIPRERPTNFTTVFKVTGAITFML